MSLQAASRIAYSSLMATQVQLALTSANIANASTAGYTTKTATLAATASGGTGSGVAVTGIAGAVDKLLMKSLVAATTTLGGATTTQSYADRLQSLFGSTSGSSSSAGTSLANSLASLESALSSLAQTPESDTLKAQAVSALETVASQLRSTSAGVQDLRADADASIETAVGTVNDNLSTIASLNVSIAAAKARGESTADMEDQRYTALQAVSGQMGVSYYVNADNQMRVATTSGQPLVDGTVHTLSYAPATAVTGQTTYSVSAPSGFSALSVNGADITAQVADGTIGGLIAQRDSVLPAVQDQIDTLASGLVTALNAVSNAATPLPAPATLTGTATTSAACALGGSGTLRVAVVDTSGKTVSSQDLDLSTYATVGDLVTALNGVSGVSASIEAAGHLVIGSTSSGNGIAVGGTGSAGGTGLSQAFGLNDLVTGTGAADIAVRASILATPSTLGLGSLDTTSTLAAGDTAVASGSTVTADALYAALTGSTSFQASGGLGARSTTFADHAADIVGLAATASTRAQSDLTTKTSAQGALSASMTSQAGVNIDEETARLTDLQNAYSAASQVMKIVNDMFQTMIAVVQAS